MLNERQKKGHIPQVYVKYPEQVQLWRQKADKGLRRAAKWGKRVTASFQGSKGMQNSGTVVVANSLKNPKTCLYVCIPKIHNLVCVLYLSKITF